MIWKLCDWQRRIKRRDRGNGPIKPSNFPCFGDGSDASLARAAGDRPKLEPNRSARSSANRLAYMSKNIKYVSHEKAAALTRHSFVGGDIILTKLGDPLGKACILPNELPGGIADLIRLRLDNSYVDKRWLCYAINWHSCATEGSYKRNHAPPC